MATTRTSRGAAAGAYRQDAEKERELVVGEALLDHEQADGEEPETDASTPRLKRGESLNCPRRPRFEPLSTTDDPSRSRGVDAITLCSKP